NPFDRPPAFATRRRPVLHALRRPGFDCRPHGAVPAGHHRGLSGLRFSQTHAMLRTQRRCGMAKSYRIAVVAGDGIGREVMPEGIAAMEAAARAYGFECQWHEFDWSCERYVTMGTMMPEDGLERLRLYDAVYLGAVGHPEVPDHVSLWGLLIPLRRGFHQYVNLRPMR